MRTTVDIEDDILAAAKEIARRGKVSVGRVLSRLARHGLTQSPVPNTTLEPATIAVHGFRPFPSRGTIVSNEFIDQLRDTEGV